MTDEKEDGLKLFSPSDEVKTPEAAKFIPDDAGKNGISPINVDHLKAKFTGLTKEELMKFANDPFWVRLRWFLFILFWLVWLLMLFAAVFIIVVTPKCKEPPPLAWWERNPLYVLDAKKLVPSTAPEASIIGVLKSKIDYLKNELGIESLLLKSIFDSRIVGFDEVKNFTNVAINLESVSTFQHEIIDYAKSRGVRVMLEFSPVYSGKEMDQFVRSVIREGEYKDFYVWYPANYTSKPSSPPNNWLSIYDAPAWEWDDTRKQFYLHQFNVTQPDLNYRNPVVVDFMSNVLKFWLNLGIQGFFLDKTEYLLEDKNFDNEIIGDSVGVLANQYSFYHHSKTFELRENVEILKKWSEIIRNASGILSVSGGILDQNQIADFVLRPLTLRQNFTASDVNATIARWIEAVRHPTWEWKCSPPNNKCISASDLNSLTIVSFLLPGMPVVYDSENFEAANSSTVKSLENKIANSSHTRNNSTFEIRPHFIKKLIELRTSPALSFGEYKSYVINTSVFAFTRIKAGFPGYLIVWNLGSEEATMNLQNYIKTVPEDITYVLKSNFVPHDLNESRSKVSSATVVIAPKTVVVFSFVPSLK